MPVADSYFSCVANSFRLCYSFKAIDAQNTFVELRGGSNMKVCITYESKYGNGKKCMEFLRDELSKDGHDVDILSIRETDPSSLPASELYIFSAPTQVGNVAGKMKKFLKKVVIPQKNAHYALITTCMNPPKTKSIGTMESLLEPKGISKAADGLMIKVDGMKGPCESGHHDQLTIFAKELTRSST
jgi:flavorubredoxin